VSRLRTLLGPLRIAAALGVVAALTVGLAQQPAQSAFSGTTGSTGNAVASSAQFCTAPPTTLTSAGDSWTESAAPTATHGGDTLLKVSAAGVRTWIRFSLPARPVGCVLDTAVLSVRARTPSPSRVIDVYRGNPLAPQWTSTAIAWANQPTGVGTRVGSASLSAAGWQTWTVTGHVTAQYTDGNNGFVLQDRSEGSGTAEQIYEDLQNATYPPTLVLTWN
jgi:hypothetical protein